jgi:hypothetical protein
VIGVEDGISSVLSLYLMRAGGELGGDFGYSRVQVDVAKNVCPVLEGHLARERTSLTVAGCNVGGEGDRLVCFGCSPA